MQVLLLPAPIVAKKVPAGHLVQFVPAGSSSSSSSRRMEYSTHPSQCNTWAIVKEMLSSLNACCPHLEHVMNAANEIKQNIAAAQHMQPNFISCLQPR
jgi:hypothetical protein